MKKERISLVSGFINEIILENFMSYEYARIPLKPGVNLVCGPNGSGKSAILLGISVALGQSYTERSKKLSDLPMISVRIDDGHVNGSCIHKPIGGIRSPSYGFGRSMLETSIDRLARAMSKVIKGFLR